MKANIGVVIVTALGVITLVAGLVLYAWLGFDAGLFATTVGVLLTAVAGFVLVLLQLQPTVVIPVLPDDEDDDFF
jgi:hypothetical protein